MPNNLNVNYFAHDYGARYSPKLIALQMAMGALGLAIYWCLIEMLYENGGYYPCCYDTISFQLHWAKADEVKRVVEEFNLFRTDGEMFSSESVLERMEKRKRLSEDRAKSGKIGGIQSGKSRRDKAYGSGIGTDTEANASRTGSNHEALSLTGESKKERYIENKEKKESNNIDEEEVKKKVLELFFFKNFMAPEFELNRFWEYYDQVGWKTSDGQVITDRIRIANSWKPLKTDNRFKYEVLSWYKGVYMSIKNHNALDNPYEVLTGLTRLQMSAGVLLISYATKDLAERVKSFVMGNNLQGSYTIEWKFDN